jgi:hypothetical protein
MSRRFQFSLRTLLVAITVFCLIFGWTIDRATRRGAAIDAIVAAGSTVLYGDGSDADEDGNYLDFWGNNPSHFWQDVKRIPVIVSYQGFALDDSLARNIKDAVPVAGLSLAHPVRDDELRRLIGLAGPCEVYLRDCENISEEAIDELERYSPNVHVYSFEVK